MPGPTRTPTRARRQVGVPQGNLVLDSFVLTQRIGALLEAALVGTGVTPSEYAVYSQLGPGPLTPSDICEMLGLPRSTLSGYLATMRRRGHTTQVPDRADGRSYYVGLSEAGRECLEVCRPRFRRALRRLMANLEVDADGARSVMAAIDRAAESAERSFRAR